LRCSKASVTRPLSVWAWPALPRCWIGLLQAFSNRAISVWFMAQPFSLAVISAALGGAERSTTRLASRGRRARAGRSRRYPIRRTRDARSHVLRGTICAALSVRAGYGLQQSHGFGSERVRLGGAVRGNGRRTNGFADWRRTRRSRDYRRLGTTPYFGLRW
jgi:hypothetical protein